MQAKSHHPKITQVAGTARKRAIKPKRGLFGYCKLSNLLS
jgi:hypothetical protein